MISVRVHDDEIGEFASVPGNEPYANFKAIKFIAVQRTIVPVWQLRPIIIFFF